MANKKIYITESQYNYLLLENEKFFVEPEKVLIVKKFLDDNFVRAGLPTIGEDGYSTTIPIVSMKDTTGTPAKNMSDKQTYELLKDKFAHIYSSAKQTNKFLAQVLKDWYYKKISPQGLLSVNEY